mmetsp:Transcript_28606/g.50365  ORF Transcript_28606/g.50365 Transcript_28606/m.50365 type:complete len:316 (+) Transcript_28606:27-974(+)
MASSAPPRAPFLAALSACVLFTIGIAAIPGFPKKVGRSTSISRSAVKGVPVGAFGSKNIFSGFRGLNSRVGGGRRRSLERRGQKEVNPALKDNEFLIDTPERAAELLNQGAVGVIPTDTSYAFVCKLSNKEGVDRMYKIKEPQSGSFEDDDDDEVQWQTSWKKGMSLLCKDIQQIQKHVDQLPDRSFKILKKTLPGPYTYILPTTNKLPRFVVEHNNQRRSWKRKEVGIRMPDNEALKAILDQTDEPLVCTSVPFWSSPEVACSLDDLENTWCSKVDFVMAQEESLGSVSTIVDLTQDTPVVLREGKGSLEGLEL